MLAFVGSQEEGLAMCSNTPTTHSADNDITSQGEFLAPEWSFKWINPSRIEAGEMMVPAQLNTDLAREFAALHLVIDDLSFALDCLVEADKLGIPDQTNLHSKVLIFSGVIAYGRCFGTGVRPVRLRPEDFEASGVVFDLEIHSYLLALRNQHVAHSVNEFERCTATAVIVGTSENGWRDGSGVGVVFQKTVGLSRRLLRRAVTHINTIRGSLTKRFEALRVEVYEEFKTKFQQDGKWKMAPMVHRTDRTNVATRRPA
jgi:hypothetical protein